MLRRIGLLNFKCFERLDLPCAPLNLLCGLNGMGKSSVIQALLVLRQSFETSGLLEGRLVLGGELTDIGEASEVVFEGAGDKVVGFLLYGDVDEPPWAWAFRAATDEFRAVGPEDLEKAFLAEGAPAPTISRVCSRPGVDVRELVLNHASLTAAGEHELLVWLDELARGVRVLVGAGLTQKAGADVSVAERD